MQISVGSIVHLSERRYVKDTNKSIEEKTRSITEKTQEKADADADKVAAEEAKETAMNEARLRISAADRCN